MPLTEAEKIAQKKYRDKNREKRNLYCKQWRKNNPEKYKATKLRDYATRDREKINKQQKETRRKNPNSILFRHAKARAKKKNLDFTIAFEDIVVPKHCPVLGLELKFNEGQWDQNSPTLDRVDNSKGYTKDNIRVISYRANTLKGMGMLDDFRKITAYMEEHFRTNTE